MTFDTRHMTHDMWHVTYGGEVNILSNCQVPSSYKSGGVLKIWRKKDELVYDYTGSVNNYSDTELFVGQPWLNMVCQIYG